MRLTVNQIRKYIDWANDTKYSMEKMFFQIKTAEYWGCIIIARRCTTWKRWNRPAGRDRGLPRSRAAAGRRRNDSRRQAR